MNPTDKLMAWAQIVITMTLLIFTFALLVIYETGHMALTGDASKDFIRSIDWLEGACLIVIYFWFQRSRTAGIPDPTQIVTQTQTKPDGTTTVITKPMAKGAPDEKTVVAPITPSASG